MIKRNEGSEKYRDPAGECAAGVGVSTDRVKVVHIITGLNTGGAEMMLLKLCTNGVYQKSHKTLIISILSAGVIKDRLVASGVRVTDLGFGGGLAFLWKIPSTFLQVVKFKGDLYQGWMYHGNLIASLLGYISFRSVSVAWNIRCSNPTPAKGVTAMVRRVLVNLAKTPDTILVNSKAGIEYHRGIGYPLDKMEYIANGIRTDLFSFERGERKVLRERYGLGDDVFVIGIAASYRPMKDYDNFLQAARYVLDIHKDVVFMAAGRGLSSENEALKQKIEAFGLQESVLLLGQVENMRQYMSALDIFTLTSKEGEGFPNVIGEAMACERPVVATDVGDCALVVGDCGVIVRKEEPQSLAKAWTSYVTMNLSRRMEIGRQSRDRIKDRFSIDSISGEYTRVYSRLVETRSPKR